MFGRIEMCILVDPHDCNTAKFIRIKPGDNPIDVKKWILGETCDEVTMFVLCLNDIEYLIRNPALCYQSKEVRKKVIYDQNYFESFVKVF